MQGAEEEVGNPLPTGSTCRRGRYKDGNTKKELLRQSKKKNDTDRKKQREKRKVQARAKK